MRKLKFIKTSYNNRLFSGFQFFWNFVIITGISLLLIFAFIFSKKNLYSVQTFDYPEWKNLENDEIFEFPFSADNNHKNLHIYTTVPEINSDTNLIIKCRFDTLSASINDKQFYLYLSKKFGPVSTKLGKTFCFIPLKKEYSGSVIQLDITMQNNFPYKSSFIGAFFDSRSNYLLTTIKNNIGLIVLSFLLLICGFWSFSFFILSYFTNKHRISQVTKSLLYVSLISFLASLWNITNSHILFIFTDNVMLDCILTYFSLLVIPILFVQLFINLYNKKILSIYFIRIFSELNFVIQVILFFTGIADLPDMLIYTHIVCLILIFLALYYNFKFSSTRNNIEKTIMYIGNGLFSVIMLVVIFMYFHNCDGDNYLNYFNIGLIIFCSMQICVCGVRFTKSTKRQAALHEAEKFAFTDQLTKLENRRAYAMFKNNNLNNKLCDKLTVLYFDLNGLKVTNDTQGHTAGDELIVGFTSILRKIFYDAQLSCRMGGDEFLVVMNCEKDIIKKRLFYLESNINSWHGDLVKKISAAWGYASSSDHPGKNFEELAKIAEKYMYQMKREYYEEKGIDRRTSHRI